MPQDTTDPSTTDTLMVTDRGDHLWEFEYPRVVWEVLEVFHQAIDLWEVGDLSEAEKQYRQLIREYPEFIDVHHHLALVLDETDREEEAFCVWREAVALGLSCFPKDFSIGRDFLLWGMLDNRPFLRAYHGLGIACLERGEAEEALSIFNSILAMNPGDNQGVRGSAIGCCFAVQRPTEALEICDRYPDDGMEHLLYGHVLALYQLKRNPEAESALRLAAASLPLVARELAKARHRRPKDMHYGYITYGGADQAYHYWIEQGRYWKKTPGAIEFVREWLREDEQG